MPRPTRISSVPIKENRTELKLDTLCGRAARCRSASNRCSGGFFNLVYIRNMNWTDEKTLTLIEMYRARPLLWDSYNPNYKNRNKRHDMLLELAEAFGVDKQEMERKIKNLQSHFQRERKKESESKKKTGSGAEETYESKWFALQLMMFLADKNKPRKTKDNSKNRQSQGSVE